MGKQKPQDDRSRESLRITRELHFMRQCPEFAAFRDAVDEYVRHGRPSSGRIGFRGTGRVLTHTDRACTACLRHAPHV